MLSKHPSEMHWIRKGDIKVKGRLVRGRKGSGQLQKGLESMMGVNMIHIYENVKIKPVLLN